MSKPRWPKACIAEGIVCLVFPRLTRWTVDVVDRVDGERFNVRSVRMIRRRSVERWIATARQHWERRGLTVYFEARRT